MLPRAFLTLLTACLLAIGMVPAGGAQAAEVRYHFGDDARWADKNLDDSSWNIAPDGRVPAPAIDTDGFVWIRMRIAVPRNTGDPLALRWDTSHGGPNVEEVYVNGLSVGRTGEFPPGATMRMTPRNLVFELPPGLAREGTFAQVVIRSWTAPIYPVNKNVLARDLSIDGVALQHALAGEAQGRILPGYMPQFALSLLLEMLGIGVLMLSLWSGRRELFLWALWLVTVPVFLTFISLQSIVVGVSWRPFLIIFELINALGMWVEVEFTWSVQGFQEKRFRRIAHGLWILSNAADIISYAFFDRRMVALNAHMVGSAALLAFNVVLSGADLAAVFGRGRNRAIGAAMLLISVGFYLRIAGIHLELAWLRVDFFGAAFYLLGVLISGLLIRQALESWKKNEGLRIEITAARELQQQLVPLALPEVAGLRLNAAYLPAQEVGGDFYQVMEQSDGATLILVGDVSGKGLKAAMTGVLTIGAARALASDTIGPAMLLTRLNREMARSSKEGFVTCLCARITRDGAVTLANAGHLAPYLNGAELEVTSALPLGITVAAEYGETKLELAPGDTLMFLSDGVVEAQNAAGELFGFARTEALANKQAGEIARAAQAFGQSDDITVLTLAFAPVHAAV